VHARAVQAVVDPAPDRARLAPERPLVGGGDGERGESQRRRPRRRPNAAATVDAGGPR
jgi:hypothetical protein